MRRNSDPVTVVEALIEGGARILQFRAKGGSSRAVFQQASRAADLCRQAGVLYIVNDRADIALLLEAGLHVGQDDLPPEDARELLGSGKMIGFSTHNAAQFAAGLGAPVDYLAIGPVFATSSKLKPDPLVGLDGIRSLDRRADIPLVAIGGITRENALDVLAAGADSVAVIHDILPDGCTFQKVRERMEEWQQLTTS